MSKLDIEQHYGFRDKSEVAWSFVFTKIGDEEGWFAFMQRPGAEKAMCIGRLSEAEIVKMIAENPALTQDDLIDFGLWVNHGGLDVYAPKKRKRIKKEIVQE